jgi:hypothetical protein
MRRTFEAMLGRDEHLGTMVDGGNYHKRKPEPVNMS